MPRNVVATSKERTMQTSRPYNLSKTQKANDNPKQNTFGKPHAACSNKFKSLESLLHGAATFQNVWKASCNPAARFPTIGLLGAATSLIFQFINSLQYYFF